MPTPQQLLITALALLVVLSMVLSRVLRPISPVLIFLIMAGWCLRTLFRALAWVVQIVIILLLAGWHLAFLLWTRLHRS